MNLLEYSFMSNFYSNLSEVININNRKKEFFNQIIKNQFSKMRVFESIIHLHKSLTKELNSKYEVV